MAPEAKRKRRGRGETPPAEETDEKTNVDFSKGTIEIIVGTTDPRSFHVHEELLTSGSEYFRRALGKNWVEASERKVRLKEHDPATFTVWLNWTYRRTFTAQKECPVELTRDGFLSIAQAYTLGDYLQDSTFKNAVVEAFLKRRESTRPDKRTRWHSGRPLGFEITAIQHAYHHTPENSNLRRLTVQSFAQCGLPAPFKKGLTASHFPPEFLFDLAIALLKERGPHGFGPINPSTYEELPSAAPSFMESSSSEDSCSD